MRSSRAVLPYDRHGRDRAPTSCFKCIESSLNIKFRWGLLVGVIGLPVTQSAQSRRSILREKKKKKTGEWEQYSTDSRVERRYNIGPKDWQNVLAIRNFRHCIAAVECANRTPRPRSIEEEVACYLRSHYSVT